MRERSKYTKTGFWQIAALVAVIACIGAVSLAYARQSSQYPRSILHVKRLLLSLEMYANDYDEGLPLPGKWIDETLIYTRDNDAYYSPAVAGQGFGYALNSEYAGTYLSAIANLDTAVLLFDSTDLSRNATDPISTEPNPGRYSGVNTEGFADGEVKNYMNFLSPPALYQYSRRRIGQLALANLMYMNDYDDVTAPAPHWADETFPYPRSHEVYRSPLIELADPTKFGYAFHSEDGERSISDFPYPAREILLFDSLKLYWNAADNGESLPNPGRYQGHNTHAFLDGHVGP